MGHKVVNALADRQHCQGLANVDIPNFVLSCFLVIGILVSYIPQHYRIIHRRSSEGLSPYFVLLGTTSGTCAIANILVLPTSRMDIACCKVNSAFSCLAGLLGVAQVGIQWSCFFIITMLFLVFIPRRSIHHPGLTETLVPTDAAWHEAFAVVAISILHFLFVFIVSVIMGGAYPGRLQTWANVLGTMGAVLASIQYLPQIWTTWRRQHIGSLSIPMMCIQTPGSAVFAFSLFARLGTKGWSAWTVYLVTGSLQAVLLFMAITFELRDREARKNGPLTIPDMHSENGFPEDDETEADPLLRHDRRLAQSRRDALRSGGSVLDSGRAIVDADSPDEDDRDDRTTLVNTLRGSGSRHTFANIANGLAAHFGIGQVSRADPTSKVTSADESALPEQAVPAVDIPRSSLTQYFDAKSRRGSASSHETIIGPILSSVDSRSKLQDQPQSSTTHDGRPSTAERRVPRTYPEDVRDARGKTRTDSKGRQAATERLCRTPRQQDYESSGQGRQQGNSTL